MELEQVESHVRRVTVKNDHVRLSVDKASVKIITEVE